MINNLNIEFTNKFFDLKEFRQYSNVLIETGTSMGDGVQRSLDAGFGLVISMEAQKEIFGEAVKRFMNNENVYIFFGRSIEHLSKILRIYGKNSVIFLDAHPAGKGSFEHEKWIDTQENFQHKNILQELDIIFADKYRHIIIIDDMRGLDTFSHEYIDKIFKANGEYVFRFYDENLTGSYLHKNKLLVAIPYL